MSPTTADTLNSANMQGRRTWGNWWQTFRWPLLVTAFFGLLISGTIYFQTASVVGTEMHPTSWEIRQFQFFRDPFTGLQLSGISYKACKGFSLWSGGSRASPIDPAINVHLAKSLPAVSRWDLVSLMEGIPSPGRASILTQLVDAQGSGGRFWVNWTTNNGPKAAVFWPAAQQLTMLDAYGKLPSVFQLATSEKEDDQFLTRLNELMGQALLDHARRTLDAGDRESAARAARAALGYGENEELRLFLSSLALE